jgi:hypothetical protein
VISAEANYEKAQKDVARFETLRKGNAATDMQGGRCKLKADNF